MCRSWNAIEVYHMDVNINFALTQKWHTWWHSGQSQCSAIELLTPLLAVWEASSRLSHPRGLQHGKHMICATCISGLSWLNVFFLVVFHLFSYGALLCTLLGAMEGTVAPQMPFFRRCSVILSGSIAVRLWQLVIWTLLLIPDGLFFVKHLLWSQDRSWSHPSVKSFFTLPDQGEMKNVWLQMCLSFVWE